MRKTLKLTLLAGAAALTGALVPGSAQTASAGAAGVTRPAAQTFHVVFSPFDYTDLGQPGPSSADVIVFHDQLSKGRATVGDEVGSCTLVDATGLSNCTGVVRLDGRGTIAFAFVNARRTRSWDHRRVRRVQDGRWRRHSRRERRRHRDSRPPGRREELTLEPSPADSASAGGVPEQRQRTAIHTRGWCS